MDMTQELARLELLFEAIPLAFATFDADLKTQKPGREIN